MKPNLGGPAVSLIVPEVEGGTNWFPPAYDPELGMIFLAVNHWGMALRAWSKQNLVYSPGSSFMGEDFQRYRLDPAIGHIKAIDIASRKVVWEYPSPLPLFAGMLVTKSGVLFTGDERGWFLAFEAKTGKLLWRFQTGSGINASPITYELDGHQYFAVLSGLGGAVNYVVSGPKGGML
jgi:alcohol dehydrogenase (cytochrome c)